MMEIVIETHWQFDAPSRSEVRARPVEGQGYSTSLNIECSKSMRHLHPVGTKFLVHVTEKRKERGALFLYTYWQWPYQVLSNDEAAEIIAKRGKSRAADA